MLSLTAMFFFLIFKILAVFYGSGITAASVIVLIIKILGWKIIKTTYIELRRRRLANMRAENVWITFFLFFKNINIKTI